MRVDNPWGVCRLKIRIAVRRPGWLQWLPKVDVEGHAAAEHITVPDTPAELVEAETGGSGGSGE